MSCVICILLSLVYILVDAMCPPLDAPVNGVVVWTGCTSGSTATYSCNDGYAQSGVEARACLSDGSWSDVPPTCEGIFAFTNSVYLCSNSLRSSHTI